MRNANLGCIFHLTHSNRLLPPSPVSVLYRFPSSRSFLEAGESFTFARVDFHDDFLCWRIRKFPTDIAQQDGAICDESYDVDWCA